MANIIKGRNKKMKKLLSAFLLLSIFFGHANGASVVGSVNGNPITDADITARTELMSRQGKTSAINRKQAFQNIIDDYVKLEYAGRYNVKPDDKDADKELKRMGMTDLGATTRAMARLAYPKINIPPHTRRDAARQVPTLFSGRTFICIFPKHPLSLRKTLNASDYGIFNRCITQVADRFPKF